jgi:hypothetical protein
LKKKWALFSEGVGGRKSPARARRARDDGKWAAAAGRKRGKQEQEGVRREERVTFAADRCSGLRGGPPPPLFCARPRRCLPTSSSSARPPLPRREGQDQHATHPSPSYALLTRRDPSSFFSHIGGIQKLARRETQKKRKATTTSIKATPPCPPTRAARRRARSAARTRRRSPNPSPVGTTPKR